MRPQSRRTAAFSLVELVCVIVIIAVLAALAIPKLSRAAGSAPDAELRRNLAVLRLAIEMYYDQHGAYPGAQAAGEAFGQACTAEAFVSQLTRYTSVDGRVADQPSPEFCYGPYLRNGIPDCPLARGEQPTQVTVVALSTDTAASAPRANGWRYECRTGHISADVAGLDARGVPFRDY